jgi:hypothetical protein
MSSTHQQKIQEFKLAVALIKRNDMAQKNLPLLCTYAVLLNINLIDNGIQQQTELMQDAFPTLTQQQLIDIREAAEILSQTKKMLFVDKVFKNN